MSGPPKRKRGDDQFINGEEPVFKKPAPTPTPPKQVRFWLPTPKLPSNVGALTRTAHVLGFNLDNGCKFYLEYSTFMKKSMMASTQIPVSIIENTLGIKDSSTVSDMKIPGKWHFVFMDSPNTMEIYNVESTNIYKLDLTKYNNYIFVFGNETHGFDLFDPETYELNGLNFINDHFVKEYPGCTYSFAHIEQAHNGVGFREGGNEINLSVVAATTITMTVVDMSGLFEKSLMYNN